MKEDIFYELKTKGKYEVCKSYWFNKQYILQFF